MIQTKKIRKNVRNLVDDFMMTMDTVVPEGVDASLFKYLKYSNREWIMNFREKYPEYPKVLICMVAVHYWLKLSDDEKRRMLNVYME